MLYDPHCILSVSEINIDSINVLYIYPLHPSFQKRKVDWGVWVIFWQVNVIQLVKQTIPEKQEADLKKTCLKQTKEAKASQFMRTNKPERC